MKIFNGIAGAPGMVCAGLICFEKKSGKKQFESFDEVVEKALEKVRMLHKKALEELGEDKAKIFSAYEMLLEDSMLTDPMKAMLESGTDTEAAVRSVTETMAEKLAKKNNEYMRQRADDIRYIGELLSDVLNGADGEFTFPDDGEKYIVAARELTPVDTMLFDTSRLAGFITEKGGATSHIIILAKSLGIPAVVGAENAEKAGNAKRAYLDGYRGELTVSPDEKTEAELKKRLEEEKALCENMEKLKSTPAMTKDGERIAVCINIGKPSDMDGAEEESIDGVGLFRSEFLYSAADKKPSCEEQIKAYRDVILKARPNGVTVRTLDAGGDKQLEYLGMEKEENPFLGNRGIRLCLNNPEIFGEQLRAILIAAAGEKVKIMLPMVSSLNEIRKTKAMICDIQSELEAVGVEYCKNPQIGIMIETPASAVMAEVFAKYSDFFSIGTNDLVQYITAADRGNAGVEELYNPYHPAVMRLLNNTIKAGNDAGIEVSVCGDMAANGNFTELLIGMGLKKFSVPLPMAARIKHKISNIDVNSAKELAQKVLSADDENEVKNLLMGR